MPSKIAAEARRSKGFVYYGPSIKEVVARSSNTMGILFLDKVRGKRGSLQTTGETAQGIDDPPTSASFTHQDDGNGSGGCPRTLPPLRDQSALSSSRASPPKTLKKEEFPDKKRSTVVSIAASSTPEAQALELLKLQDKLRLLESDSPQGNYQPRKSLSKITNAKRASAPEPLSPPFIVSTCSQSPQFRGSTSPSRPAESNSDEKQKSYVGYKAVKSKATAAVTTTTGTSPNFSPEVNDKLSASLVTLRRWVKVNHPDAKTLAFVKKMDAFCGWVMRQSSGSTKKKSVAGGDGGDAADQGSESSEGPEGASMGTLRFDDDASHNVGGQGFAIALTPLYHVPHPSILLTALRVREDAFYCPRPAAASSNNEPDTINPSASEVPRACRAWSDRKRNALLDLLRNVRTIAKIEVVSVTHAEDGTTCESVGANQHRRTVEQFAKEAASSEEGGTVSSRACRCRADLPFINGSLLPLLSANQKHTRKASRQLERDVLRIFTAQQAMKVKAVTTELCCEQSEAYEGLVKDEAKERHKLSALCHVHKTASRRQQQRRLLEERFISEQQSMVRSEGNGRALLMDDEAALVRRLLLLLFTSDVKDTFVPLETKERKAIRDWHHARSYEIRQMLNNLFERKRVEKEEMMDFEKKHRKLIIDDEKERRAIWLTAHANICTSLGAYALSTVEHRKRMASIMGIDDPTVPPPAGDDTVPNAAPAVIVHEYSAGDPLMATGSVIVTSPRADLEVPLTARPPCSEQ